MAESNNRTGNSIKTSSSDGNVKKYRQLNTFFQQKEKHRPHLKLATTVVCSGLSFGLLISSPAWGLKAIDPHNKPLIPVSSSPYLTTLLPPLTQPDIWNSVSTEAVLKQQEILFIDQGVEKYQDLLSSVSREVEIVFINSGEDGVAAIAAHLEGRSDIQGIHIVSHGGSGRLFLGNVTLTAEDIPARSGELALWSRALVPEGDVFLYGCEVAKGLEGIRFVNRLSHALRTDISASDDPTGSPALGGDWSLEYNQNGATEELFAASVAQNFHALLAEGQLIVGDGSGGGGGGGGGGHYRREKYDKYSYTYYFGVAGDGGDGGAGGGGDDIITGSVGDDVIFGDGSGGGGGGAGEGFGKYYSSEGGSGGSGGSGSDTLYGSEGNDIIFGDGFDGANGLTDRSGGSAGFDNSGGGGTGQDTYGGNGSAGNSGFGGALGGVEGTYSQAGSAGNGGKGGDGLTIQMLLPDTGSGHHTEALAKISSDWFSDKSGGGGDDILDGGPGSDELFGMGGSNNFIFESDDATSGIDVDSIHDWNKGNDNKISLTTGGRILTDKKINSLLPGQTVDGEDRTIVHGPSGSQVSIVVKNIDRDLVLEDFYFVEYKFPWPMFLPAIANPKKE